MIYTISQELTVNSSRNSHVNTMIRRMSNEGLEQRFRVLILDPLYHMYSNWRFSVDSAIRFARLSSSSGHPVRQAVPMLQVVNVTGRSILQGSLYYRLSESISHLVPQAVRHHWPSDSTGCSIQLEVRAAPNPNSR